jgi:hypothetical protein
MSGAKVELMGTAFGGKIFHAVSQKDTVKVPRQSIDREIRFLGG